MKWIVHVLVAIAILAALPANVSPAQAASPGFVLVNYGDTLSTIAARNGTTVDALVQANGLPNSTFIWVGQCLAIPSGNSVAAPVAAPPGAGAYTISQGDTIQDLAARFGITVDALAIANGLSNVDSIFVGQRLVVPGGMKLPAPQPAAAPSYNPAPAPVDGKWIDVDISAQRITAYDGTTPLKSVLVSTGIARHPTPMGEFKVYLKVASQTMTGGVGVEHYVLPGVLWIMYFSGSNAIHGTYWHENFGHPMSHGCVNLMIADAKWFYDWAPVGTPVISHP